MQRFTIAGQQVESGKGGCSAVQLFEKAAGRRVACEVIRDEAAARRRVGRGRRFDPAEIGDRPESTVPRHAHPGAASAQITAGKHAVIRGPPAERRRRTIVKLVAVRRDDEPVARVIHPGEHDQAHGGYCKCGSGAGMPRGHGVRPATPRCRGFGRRAAGLPSSSTSKAGRRSPPGRAAGPPARGLQCRSRRPFPQSPRSDWQVLRS